MKDPKPMPNDFEGTALLDGFKTPHLLEQIVDSVADPIFVKDEAHRWIMLNEALCTFLGHPREALLGKTDHDFFPKEEANIFWEKDAEVFASGLTNVNEESFTDAEGKTHTIVTKKSIFLDAQGKKVLVGIIRDITDLKDSQAALEAARDELEERVKTRTAQTEKATELLHQSQKMDAIGKLAAGVAHDFNNLLTVVQGNLELIMLSGAGNTQLEALADQALGAVRRGATLTRRMLDYAEHKPRHPRPTNLSPLVRGVQMLLSRTLSAEYSLSIQTEFPQMVSRIEPTRFETAFINLVLQARNAMPDGGIVSVVLKKQMVSEVQAEDFKGVKPGLYLVLAVTDKRPTLSSEAIAQMKNPSAENNKIGPTANLGLAMAADFATEAKGFIMVDSDPVLGTCVRLFLPENTGLYQVEGVGGTQLPRYGSSVNKSVLVVEDEPAVRSMATMFLTALGYTVYNAANAIEAIEQLKSIGPVDVLLTDIILGGGQNGHDLAQDIIGSHPDTKHIYMTGYADADTRRDLEKDNAPLLKKPFRLAELEEAMVRVLDSAPA
jgi:PAS domain S-box-containing protein